MDQRLHSNTVNETGRDTCRKVLCCCRRYMSLLYRLLARIVCSNIAYSPLVRAPFHDFIPFGTEWTQALSEVYSEHTDMPLDNSDVAFPQVDNSLFAQCHACLVARCASNTSCRLPAAALLPHRRLRRLLLFVYVCPFLGFEHLCTPIR